MTCRFQHLTFGESYPIVAAQVCCHTCGADTSDQTKTTDWIYRGHSGSVDIFEAVTPFRCWSCGILIRSTNANCEDGGFIPAVRESVSIERKTP